MRKNTGCPKNEGYTRNFLGRGSVTLHLFPNEFDYHLNRAGSVALHLSPNEFDYHLNRAARIFDKFRASKARAKTQGSRKMRVIPEIFWEEEMPQSRRLNFITIKFGASKAYIDDDYLYSLYKSLIVAYTKSGVIPNFSKSSFVPSPLRTNTEFIPAFFPQAMSV